jgi:hypothetical protein
MTQSLPSQLPHIHTTLPPVFTSVHFVHFQSSRLMRSGTDVNDDDIMMI